MKVRGRGRGESKLILREYGLKKNFENYRRARNDDTRSLDAQGGQTYKSGVFTLHDRKTIFQTLNFGG